MVGHRTCHAITVFLIISVLSHFGSPVALAEEPQESLGVQVDYAVASTLLTVVHVPLKVALCAVTNVMSGLAYLLTFGSKPVARDASDAIKAACTGPYIITPQRLRTNPE